MCGIAGIIDWQKLPNPASIESMTQAMHRRGPDFGAVKVLGPVILGHRRLSIQDTRENAHQPMSNPTQTVWITFNGEIYNFKLLQKTLENKGYTFRTHSDTEVILAAWEEWREQCVDHLVGMFAFCLWDTRDQTLFLARDRLGEKPLFYAYLNNDPAQGLLFASTLQALLCHPQAPKQINPYAIHQFLHFNYILSDTCIIQNVYKLPAAHYLRIKRNSPLVLKPYWNLSHYFHQKQAHSASHLSETLNQLLLDSVRGEAISDVPLGAFLSGGMDSSAIVSKLSQVIPKNQVNTFSMDFEESSYSELAKSQTVARHLNVHHHTQRVESHLAETLPVIVQNFHEPFADTSMIPMYYLAQFTRKQVTVSLSGDGADELFLGYETYIADKIHHAFQGVPKFFFRWMASGVDRFMPVSHRKQSLESQLKRWLSGMQCKPTAAHLLWRQISPLAVLPQLLSSRYYEGQCEERLQAYLETLFAPVKSCHYLDQASYVDIKTWLVDDILVKVDQTSMAHSLEVRAPFLDHRLVEFAAQLPVSYKLNGFQKKWLLKQALKHELPPSILHAKKRGFNAPVSIWLTNSLVPLAKAALYESPLKEWLEKPFLDKLWHEHLSRQQDHGLVLFGLTCLGLWLTHFYETLPQGIVPHDNRDRACL